MGEKIGFTLEQLMELAGLSVAASIFDAYPPAAFSLSQRKKPAVLVICGPGNNGGDGLVASRHLFHFGYDVGIVYPKRTSKPFFSRLVDQFTAVSSREIFSKMLSADALDSEYDLIVDGIFGFSFAGDIRAPFDSIISDLAKVKKPIVSIDIPSGWNVEDGDTLHTGFSPSMLVSLTAPKKCAQFFKGQFHYLGGRFIPPTLSEKYELNLPTYPGSSCFVRLPKIESTSL